MVTCLDFKNRSRRGDEAESFWFCEKSASLRRRLRRRRSGALMIELLVAMAMMVGVLLPLAYSITSEKRLARAAFHRAVAMEIVDGEIEILAAGEWRNFSPGQHEYPIHAVAATNLPPGRFLLTVGTDKMRLEWQPSTKQYGRAVVIREAKIK